MTNKYYLFLVLFLVIGLSAIGQTRHPYYDVKYILKREPISMAGDYRFMTTEGQLYTPNNMSDSILHYDRIVPISEFDIQGYGFVIYNNKLAFIDSVGNIISGFDYDLILYYDPNGLFPVFKDKRWGVLDANFNEVLPFQFRRFKIFDKKGFIALDLGHYAENGDFINHYWGVIDSKTGEEIIGYAYDDIVSFDGNFIKVIYKGYNGLINTKGKLLHTSSDYIHPRRLRNNIYMDDRDYKYGKQALFDMKGNDYMYDGNRISALGKNLIAVQEGDWSEPKYGAVSYDIDTITYKGKDFYKLKTVIDFKYDYLSPSRTPYGGAVAKRDGLNIYIDSLGIERIVSPHKLEVYGEDGIRVYVDEKGDKYNLYDLAGNFISEDLKYPSVTKEFLHRDYDSQSGKYGYYQFQTGELVIPHRYKIAESFNSGYAIVGYRENKGGLIDSLGNEVIPIVHNGIEYSGSKHVLLRKGKDYYFSDLRGNRSPETYQRIDNIHGLSGQYKVRSKEGYWGTANEEGTQIVRCTYDTLYYNPKLADYLIVGQKGKIGLAVKETGREVVPCLYDEIQEAVILDKPYYIVRKEKLWGLLDSSGTLKIPMGYDIIEPYYGNLLIVAKDVTCEGR